MSSRRRRDLLDCRRDRRAGPGADALPARGWPRAHEHRARRRRGRQPVHGERASAAPQVRAARPRDRPGQVPVLQPGERRRRGRARSAQRAGGRPPRGVRAARRRFASEPRAPATTTSPARSASPSTIGSSRSNGSARRGGIGADYDVTEGRCRRPRASGRRCHDRANAPAPIRVRLPRLERAPAPSRRRARRCPARPRAHTAMGRTGSRQPDARGHGHGPP